MVSDKKLPLGVYAGEKAVKTMVGAGSPREYLTGTQPLVGLIDELSQKQDRYQILIRNTGFLLILEMSSACAQLAQTGIRAL